jgi:hypothetical protein
MHPARKTGVLHLMAIEDGCFPVTKSTVFLEFRCDPAGRHPSPVKG